MPKEIHLPTRIILQVRSPENIFLCHCEVVVNNPIELEKLFSNLVEQAASKGILTIEHNQIGMTFKGVQVEKSIREKRSEYYQETGN